MKRIIGTTLILALGALALAIGGFTKPFLAKYDVQPDSKLGKAGCALCHMSAKNLKLNGYGTDLAKALKAAGVKKPTAAVFEAIEKLDSNKNGKTNLEDIKAGNLP